MKKSVLIVLVSGLIIGITTAQDVNLEWAKSMGGIGGDIGQCIDVDNYGNIYITGKFNDTVDFDPNIGTYNLISENGWDCYIQKLDSQGNLIWAKSIGGGSAVGYSIAIDDSGNVITTGYFLDTVDFDPNIGTYNLISEYISDCFIQKLDSMGNFVWAKSIGGAGNIYGKDITFDKFGNIYLTGYFRDTVDFDTDSSTYNIGSKGSGDLFVQKLDYMGNLIWINCYGSSGYEDGVSLAVDDFGNLYVTGSFTDTVDFDSGSGSYFLTSNGMRDGFVQKLDIMGNLVWAKSTGGIGDDNGKSIAIDYLGNIYTTGIFWGTVDFDPNIGTYNLISENGWDCYIQKLDTSGNLLWAKSVNGTSLTEGFSLSHDSLGNVYITGVFVSTADFDPSEDTYNISSNGQTDVFVQKLDMLGNFIWATAIGGKNIDYCFSITIDNHDNIYATGYFYDTIDFNQDTGINNLISMGEYDIFVVKWKQYNCSNIALVIDSLADITNASSGYASVYALNGRQPYNYTWNTIPIINDSIAYFDTAGTYEVTVIDAIGCTRSASVIINEITTDNSGNTFTSNINLYPNPNSGNITIQLGNKYNNVNIELYSITGQLLQQESFSKTNTINMDINVPQGMYFISVISGNNERATYKVVRE